MVHYGAGRLSLKGSCSIRAPAVGRAGGSAERWSVTLLWNPPRELDRSPPWRRSIIRRVLALRILVVPWPCIPTVAAAAVHTSTRTEQRLCAFIVVSGGNRRSETELPDRVHSHKHLNLGASRACKWSSVCVFYLHHIAMMCIFCAPLLRRTSLPVQPVRRLLHPEGQPATSHQAPLRGEALQVPPMQLRLPPEGRPHRPPTHPLGWVRRASPALKPWLTCW